MLMLTFLLLPMVLATADELRINDYIVKIENGTLTNVQTTERSTDELNLSSLGIQRINENAFDTVNNAKILNLANNSIDDLPKSIFSHLKNLEHLHLENNNIYEFGGAFVGLSNLKTLNISYNPITTIEAQAFLGLRHSIEIFTTGNSFNKISTGIFEHNVTPDYGKYRKRGLNRDEFNDHEAPLQLWKKEYQLNPDFRIKICIDHGKVNLLDNMEKNELLVTGCSEVKSDEYGGLTIDDFGITEFDRSWYRVKNTREMTVKTISLKDNNITRVTRELFNDLPESISIVDLSGNKIHRLESGVINNSHIHFLVLSDNLIAEIEDGALSNMNLWQLYLNRNRLNSTKFIATLPTSLVKLFLNENNITELSILPEFDFRRFTHLHITRNNITVVRNNSLRGLPFLLQLDLSSNRIRTLESGCFGTIKNVYFLELRNNDLRNVDGGVFNDLPRLAELDLGMNKLTTITEQFRNSLPHELKVLRLDYNLLENLESGSFVNVPKDHLDLEGNKISKIAKGAFYVPSMYGMDVEHEPLDESALLESMFGVSDLTFALSGGNPLPKKEKGIGSVHLSKNLIKRLENGVMFGIRKGTYSYIYLSENPIELIQGGLFDNV